LLPVNGSFDNEISIRGIDNIFIKGGIENWSLGGPVDDDNNVVE
jgi:hypothetical protein